ncbi:3-dehydroquinate synthase [Pseudidiomarina andamanensis]|uniref:3-dehydroquinate synthase n=1 Tax=Pseudidiomarina andamanensis TaxID=1940690 RepID=A0AA92IM64_9GAMM|nr:3-dehydroquinate synthase [Pseudidiomarina andamanensis]MDS0219395.1 3-dehydroquinate synthase [Pseudidiomarina andamanensis]QGT96118.1 3-dehydroquinate synthase [Pseudidiomarina andamanensis]
MQNTTQQIIVGLGERSYPIDIGAGLLSRTPLFEQLPQQVLLLSNTVVDPLYGDQVRAKLEQHTLVTHLIEDGESAKSFTNFEAIIDTLIRHNFNRDCAIIALGGGVVGDLAGFVAATYQRGVAFYQIPTTLLAQVDSSVGGKTAINHTGGKNLVGAFYQPQAVLIDTDCLKTLNARDYACGLAEVVKYGIIADAEFFAWLEAHQNELNKRDAAALTYAIQRSCEIKAEVVAADEREQSVRALLNLGHTFGHAIEAAHYESWRHGEAVAAGTIVAAYLMHQQGRLSSHEFTRIETLLQQLNLPIRAPEMPLERWQTFMQRDKKVQAGVVRLVLPTAIGQACLEPWSDWQAIGNAIAAMSHPEAHSPLL